jgi:DNA-binding NtrC family response regulator
MVRFKILIVDDEHNVIAALKRFLSRHNYEVDSATDGEQGLTAISKKSFDLVLLDLKMPGMDGMTVLVKALAIDPDLNIIIQTGHGGVVDAVQALKLGATDFLEKNCDPAILRTRVEQVHKQWSLRQANAALAKKSHCSFSYPDLIGESATMLKLKDMITRVAPTDATILIQGESGTGKEIVSRAIVDYLPPVPENQPKFSSTVT